MNIFGWSIVRTETLKEYEARSISYFRLVECFRWFSGCSVLDIVWDYVFVSDNIESIERTRNKYAKARNTDEYGNPITIDTY